MAVLTIDLKVGDGDEKNRKVCKNVSDFATATIELLIWMHKEFEDGSYTEEFERWLELWRDSPKNSPVEVKALDGRYTYIFKYDPS